MKPWTRSVSCWNDVGLAAGVWWMRRGRAGGGAGLGGLPSGEASARAWPGRS